MKDRPKISAIVQRELIIQSCGRCMICNKDLSKSYIQGNRDFISNIAHIRAYSPNGPRYDPEYEDVNGIDNLMLLCPDCHKIIDSHPDMYDTDMLLQLKDTRVRLLTNMLDGLVGPCYDVLVCSAPVSDYNCPLDDSIIKKCLFREGVIQNPEIITVLKSTASCESPHLVDELNANFDKRIGRAWDDGKSSRICVFGFGPMYLLMSLGKRLRSNSSEVLVAIKTREKWLLGLEEEPQAVFRIVPPAEHHDGGKVVLEIDCSAQSNEAQIRDYFGDIDVWKIEQDNPRIDGVSCQEELHRFEQIAVSVVDKIMRSCDHPAIYVVPRMCNALAITFGKSLMSKSQPDIVVCDVQKDDESKYEICEIGSL